MKRLTHRLVRGDEGQDLIEYGLLVGIITVASLVAITEIGGKVMAYVGEGRFTEDKLDTFGGYGVIEIPEFQNLLQFICRNGYEHHVAATKAEVAEAIEDALRTYLGWDVYHHQA